MIDKVEMINKELVLKCPECKTVGYITRGCPGCNDHHVNQLLQVDKKIGCPICLGLFNVDKIDMATGEVELTLVKKHEI